MTADERHKIAALDAYNAVWGDTAGMSAGSRRLLAFGAAWEAAKAAGANNQEATQAADFARDEAKQV